MPAIGSCAICGEPITPRFELCAACEKKWGVVGLSQSAWPEWLRYLVNQHRQERRAEREQLEYEVDAPELYDLLAYGEFNSDGLDDDLDPTQTGSAGGSLVCMDCGYQFSDIWPTWPESPTHWQVPKCQACGSGWLSDASAA